MWGRELDLPPPQILSQPSYHGQQVDWHPKSQVTQALNGGAEPQTLHLKERCEDLETHRTPQGRGASHQEDEKRVEPTPTQEGGQRLANSPKACAPHASLTGNDLMSEAVP